MKNNKVIIILIIFAILLIGVGGIFLIVPPVQTKEQKVIETRNYQIKLSNAPKSEGVITPKVEAEKTFEKDLKSIGFKEGQCTVNNCYAKNKPYKDYDYEDVIDITKDETGNPMLLTVTYFHKKDLTTEKVSTTLNNITGNYFGTKTTKEHIEKAIESMKKSKDSLGITTFTSGIYTISISIQNIPDTDFKMLKYRALTTDYFNGHNKR